MSYIRYRWTAGSPVVGRPWAALLALASLLAASAATAAPGVELQTTIGKAADFCTDAGNPENCMLPPSDTADIFPGEDIAVGYEITNTGDVALDRHTLVDSAFGTILNDSPYVLMPASSAFIVQRQPSSVDPGTHTRSATWTAGTTVVSAADFDVYGFNVLDPMLSLDVRVSPASAVCSDTNDINTCGMAVFDSIAWVPGQRVVVTYEITNTGEVPFTAHDVEDEGLGVLLTNLPFHLAPSASAFLSQFDEPAAPVQRQATWTATTEEGVARQAVDTYAISDAVFADGFE